MLRKVQRDKRRASLAAARMIEGLERRQLMSVSAVGGVSVNWDAGTGALLVQGTAGNDNIKLVSNTQSGVGFHILANGADSRTAGLAEGSLPESATEIKSLKIQGGAGNDSLDIYDLRHLTSIVANSFGRQTELYGDAGADTLRGGAYIDYLVGGFDYDANDGADTLAGEAGNDEIRGGRGGDQLDGGAGDDSLRGDADADRLTGAAGNDNLQGGSGDDIYVFRNAIGSETDDVTESSGTNENTLDFSRLTADEPLNVNLGISKTTQANKFAKSNTREVRIFSGLNVLGSSYVANVHGGAGDDTLIGNDMKNTIYGGLGNDNIKGLGGNDYLVGNEGNDYIEGNAGSDFLAGGYTYSDSVADNDVLVGGTGVDLYYVEGPQYSDDEIDTIRGGSGDDIIYGSSGDSINDGTGNDAIYINGEFIGFK